MTCRARHWSPFFDVVTNPLTASSNTIIGNLFMVFNVIIAIMGIVWFLFIGIRHVVRTGHRAMSLTTDGRRRNAQYCERFYDDCAHRFRLESGTTGRHALGRIHHGHWFRQYHGFRQRQKTSLKAIQ